MSIQNKFSKLAALMLAGALLLTGCGNLPGSGEPVEEVGQALVTSDVEAIWERTYPHTYNSASGSYNTELRSDGSANICYTDFATGQKIVLCSQLNCAHDNEACSAWVNAVGGKVMPIPVGDKIVLLYAGSTYNYEMFGDAASARVEIMNADGTDRRLIHTFAATEQVPGKPFAGIARDKENLYFAIEDSQTGPGVRTIYAANVISGTVTPVYQMTHEEEHIVGGVGNQLILEYSVGAFDMSIPGSQLVTQVVRLDPATGETVPLFKHSYIDAGGCKNGQYILLQTDHMLRSYDLMTGELVRETPVELGDSNDMLKNFDWGHMYFMGIYDGKLLVNSFPVNTEELRNWVGEDPEHHSIPWLYYGIDIETGTAYEVHQTYQDGDDNRMLAVIAAETDSHFLLRYSSTKTGPMYVKKLDGTVCDMGFSNDIYGFVPKEDFWNDTGKIIPVIDATK